MSGQVTAVQCLNTVFSTFTAMVIFFLIFFSIFGKEVILICITEGLFLSIFLHLSFEIFDNRHFKDTFVNLNIEQVKQLTGLGYCGVFFWLFPFSIFFLLWLREYFANTAIPPAGVIQYHYPPFLPDLLFFVHMEDFSWRSWYFHQ